MTDKNAELLREWHDRLGAMISQVGQPDYSLREMVVGMRDIRNEMYSALATAPQDATSNAEGQESGKPVKVMQATETGGIRSPAPSAPPLQQQDDCVRVPEDAFESWYNRAFRTRHADTGHINDCEEAWNAALLAAAKEQK